MSSFADWALLILGLAGFGGAAYLAFHFFSHRDRRRANRRASRERQRKGRRTEDR